MVKRHGFLGFFAHLFVAVFCAFLCIDGAHAAGGENLQTIKEWYTELAENGLHESPDDATYYFGLDGEQIKCPYDNYCGVSSIPTAGGTIKDLYDQAGEKVVFKTYKTQSIGEEELKANLGEMYANVENGETIVTDILNYTFNGVGRFKCPAGTRTIDQWTDGTPNGCQCYYGNCTGDAPSLDENSINNWSATMGNELELSRNGWLGDNDSSGAYSGVAFNPGIFVNNKEIETYSWTDWNDKLNTLLSSGAIGGHIYLAALAPSAGDQLLTGERFNQIKTCKASSDNGVYGGVGSSCLRLYAFAPNGLPYVYDLESAKNGELVRKDIYRTSTGDGSVYDVEDPDDLAIGCSMYFPSSGGEPQPSCYYLGYDDDGVAIPLSRYNTDHIVDVLTVLYTENTDQNLAGWTTMADAFDGAWPLTLAFNGDDEGPDSFSGGSEYNGEDSGGETGGGTTTTYTCSAGTYLPKNSTSCSQCLAGYYCTGGTWTGNSSYARGLTDCGAGYKSDAGATSASACTLINYAIHYELDGGTNAVANPAQYNVKTSTITLANPTKNGYTFDGWYSDSAYTTKVTQIASGSVGVKYLYAKWNANSVTCAAGKYLPANSTTCTTCDEDYYCPGGTFNQSTSIQGRTACPEPTFENLASTSDFDTNLVDVSQATGLTRPTATKLSECSAYGTYEGGQGVMYALYKWDAATNKYAFGPYDHQWFHIYPGSVFQIPAKCGPYAFYDEAWPCPAGYYCDKQGNTPACNSSNQATVHVDNYGATPCPAGTYNDVTGAQSVSACKTCPDGTTSTAGSTSCKGVAGTTVTITLDNQGAGTAGTGNVYYKYNNKTSSCTYYSNSATTTCLNSISVPQKSNYEFQGYYTEKDGKGVMYINSSGSFVNNLYQKIAVNTTLYAHWQGMEYSVVYYANGGTGTMSPSKHYYGTPSALTMNQFTNGTKRFAGWGTSASDTLPVLSNGEFVSNLVAPSGNDSSITLYAIWENCQACNPGTGANCTLTAPKGVCTYTTSCKSGYSNIKNNGQYNPSCSIVCAAGKYLPKGGTTCQTCTAGNYCPGGNFDYSTTAAQGINSCPSSSSVAPTNDEIAETWQLESMSVDTNGVMDISGVSNITGCMWGSGIWVGEGSAVLLYDVRTYNTTTRRYTTLDTNKSGFIEAQQGYYLSNAIACSDGNIPGYSTGGVLYKNFAKCPAGSFCAQMSTPLSCSEASFETSPWLVACPVGSYTNKEGVYDNGCTVCPAGKTTSDLGQTSCNATCANSANVATWETPSMSSTSMAPRPGYIYSVANLCKIKTCAAGYTLENNKCVLPKTTCTVGKYLPANSTTCAVCPAGKFCNGGSWSKSSDDQGYEDCPSYNPDTTSSVDASAGIVEAVAVQNFDDGIDGVDSCQMDVIYSGTKGEWIERRRFDSSTDNKYSSTQGVYYFQANKGYYLSGLQTMCLENTGLAKLDTTASGVTYYDIKQCEAGYYCPNSTGTMQTTTCGASDNTATLGRTQCAAGTTSAAGATKCDAITYKITYDADGGTMPASYRTTYTLDDAEFALPTPTKTGYTFFSWYDTDSKEQIESTQKFVPSDWASDVTFTAKWTPIVYTVRFDAGSGSTPTYTTVYEKYNTGWYSDASTNNEIKKITIPTKDGYTFGGFFTDYKYSTAVVNTDGTLASPFFTGSNGSTSINFTAAKWTANTYTITYNLNGGTNPAGAPSSYTVETATFDLPTPTRAGTSDIDYGFLGWYENSGLTGTAVTKISTGSTGNKTYWAKWTEIKRPVSQSVECDAGTYIAAGATTCTTCTAGYACAGGSYTIPKAGATSDTGRVQCTGATYAGAGATQCTSCPSPYTHDTSAGKTKIEQCTVQTSAPDDTIYGQYVKDARGGLERCPAGYYCPSTIVAYGSTNSPIACPSPTTYVPTTWPTNYRNPTVAKATIEDGGAPAVITQCMAQYLLNNDAGTIFVLNYYNAQTNKYDIDVGSAGGHSGYYMWYVSLNPGYYFTKKWQQTIDGTTMDWCQASSSSDGDIPQLYQDAAPCPAGSYCPGYNGSLDMWAENPTIPDNWPKCGDGEYTDINGINACPTTYPNSAVKSSAIEQCWLTTTAGKYVASAKADQVQCLANNYCAGGTTVNYGSTGGMQSCATGYESAAGASKCNVITYTITYNLDGGAAPKANPTTYTVETPTITLAAPTKTGYTFDGWYSDAAFKNQVKQIAQGSTGNKTLWAKWTIDTYHINYVLNNGTNDPRNPTTFTGADTTVHIYPASRTGYTMDGWGSEFIGELLAPDVDIENPYSDFDLQAQWTANTYTITLDVNGGTGGQASVTATYDAVLPTLTKLPTKVNWVFMGYFDATTGGVQYYDASGHPTSTAKWSETNGMTLYAQYAQDIVSCIRGRYYNGTSMVQCPAGMYCSGTGSVDAGVAGCGVQCPTSHANSAGGAASANECFTSCEGYDLVGGTAVPASPRVNYPANCTFNGVSDTGNPCDIVDGQCKETSCKGDYEMISGRCTPCDREHALSYKTTGNCVVASCEPGFHPDSRQCVENTMECYAPNAVSAVREWDSRTNSFTICRITECESGFHIMSNACISDIQPCTLENGTGTKEWNHTTGAYGECVASECAPGYTNDPYDSHNPGAQCGECKNKYDAAGNQVASTYVRGCEIASCMYQGEKYALDGGECVSICDEHSDETGSMKWNGKKCIRTCNDGYMPW